jgi:hypothetical protein
MIRIVALSSLLVWGLAQAGDCSQAGGRADPGQDRAGTGRGVGGWREAYR